MKAKLIIAILGCGLFLFAMTGCLERIEPTSASEYFDFRIDQDVTIDVDYCFPKKDYVVVTEVYDEYPLIENEIGELVKKEIEPIYRGATDGSGKLLSAFKALTATTKVWIYSDYPGTLSPIEVEIVDSKVVYNQNEFMEKLLKAKTRAVTPGNNHTYPDGWRILGEWDQYGTPAYLDAGEHLPEARLLHTLKTVFIDGDNPLINRYRELLEGKETILPIKKATKIYLSFVNSTAGWKNSIGYYTFKEGEEPKTPADVKRILAFPNVTPVYKPLSGGGVYRGALTAGNRVQLKYWDEVKGQFVDEFPAGVSIGFWLEGMSYNGANTGEIKLANNEYFYSRFSSDKLNKDGMRRTVATRDPQSKKIVAIAFEDSKDLNYNDATFYVEVSEDDAIDTGKIPELPVIDPPTSVNTVQFGTLMFEDLWPSAGDYDMNDVMIQYKNTIYKNAANGEGSNVLKVVSEYTPYHSGGSLTSAFAVQFTGLNAGYVRSVSIARGDDGTSEKVVLESGQVYPTIILCEDIRAAINQKITLTVEMNDAPEKTVSSAFNPFIYVDKKREREVHFVNYKPTDKATGDGSLLGKFDDGSRPGQNLYYVMKSPTKQFPFALNMMGVKEMPVPQEKVLIDVSYPDFRKWVESKGKENKDWYLKPSK